MARGPDAKGTGAGFSLKDELFNATSLSDLGSEFSVLPGFDADQFVAQSLSRFPQLGLLERLEWMADCLETQLPTAFPAMAEALHTAMPAKLDPTKTDDDFGRFIHALPGILSVRHGLEDHRDTALDLLYNATQRFSMEFYIRPFLNRWPTETLARLRTWATDDNYHVRRLVSEGTRPRLPWARNLTLDPLVPLEFLDMLHADGARFVTRSVSNHLNDISKIHPDIVVEHLKNWQEQGQQAPKELDWMTRHALRTAVKRGEPQALALLGYRTDADMDVELIIQTPILDRGDTLKFDLRLTAEQDCPVMVDYRIRFARPKGAAEKVFKLKTAKLKAAKPMDMSKAHKLKADASTFTLHPGAHAVIIQVNGVDRAEMPFELR